MFYSLVDIDVNCENIMILYFMICCIIVGL